MSTATVPNHVYAPSPQSSPAEREAYIAAISKMTDAELCAALATEVGGWIHVYKHGDKYFGAVRGVLSSIPLQVPDYIGNDGAFVELVRQAMAAGIIETEPPGWLSRRGAAEVMLLWARRRPSPQPSPVAPSGASETPGAVISDVTGPRADTSPSLSPKPLPDGVTAERQLPDGVMVNVFSDFPHQVSIMDDFSDMQFDKANCLALIETLQAFVRLLEVLP